MPWWWLLPRRFRRSVPAAAMYVRRPARRRREALPTPSPITANRSKSCARAMAMCVILFPTYSATTPDNNQTFIRQHQVSTSPLHRDSGARAHTHQVMNNSSIAGCTPALCLHVSCIWRSIVVMRSRQARETGTPPTPAELGQAPGRSPQKLTRPRAQPPASVSTRTHTYDVPFARVPVPAVGHRPAHRDWATQARQRPGGPPGKPGAGRADLTTSASPRSPLRRRRVARAYRRQVDKLCGGDGEY